MTLVRRSGFTVPPSLKMGRANFEPGMNCSPATATPEARSLYGIPGRWALGDPGRHKFRERPQKKQKVIKAEVEGPLRTRKPNQTRALQSPLAPHLRQVPVAGGWGGAWRVPPRGRSASLLLAIYQLETTVLNTELAHLGTHTVLRAKPTNTTFLLCLFRQTTVQSAQLIPAPGPSQLHCEVTQCPVCTRCESKWEMRREKGAISIIF